MTSWTKINRSQILPRTQLNIPYIGMGRVDKGGHPIGSSHSVQLWRFPGVISSSLVYTKYTDPLRVRRFEQFYVAVSFALNTQALYFCLAGRFSIGAFQQYSHTKSSLTYRAQTTNRMTAFTYTFHTNIRNA